LGVANCNSLFFSSVQIQISRVLLNPLPSTLNSVTTYTNMSDTSEKHVSKRGCLKSTRSRIILAIVALVVIIAAVVPSVVVTTLHKKNNSMGPKAKVFVPLYVYPAPGAWTPLENVYVLTLSIPPKPSPQIPYCISGGRWSATQSHGVMLRRSGAKIITSPEKKLYLTAINATVSLPTLMSTLPS
jgi:hypothetical protein